MRIFAIFIDYGIELNNFYYSGLINQLKEKAKIIIFTPHNNLEIINKLKETNCEIISIKLKNHKAGFIEKYFLSCRRARLRINGINPFGWQGNTREKKKSDYLIGNVLVYKTIQFVYHRIIVRKYFNKELSFLFKKHQISDVMMQAYSASQAIEIGVTTQQSKIKSWLFNWSWKDFYTNEYIPFNINKFFTWNNEYKYLYNKFNKHIDLCKIKAIGNLSFDVFHNYKPKKDLAYYCQKYNFHSSKKIIIVTLINPKVFPNENQLLKKLFVESEIKFSDVVFLVKPNPMDSNSDDLKKEFENSNVILLENLWFYHEKLNFNCYTHDAKAEWLDLLYYSIGTINIASTIMIESLLMQKPVININYGNDISETAFIQKFLKAPYYRNITQRDDVLVANNITEMLEHIQNIKNEKVKVTEGLNKFLENNNNVTQLIISEIYEDTIYM
jgi:hypothetical protein